MKAAADNWLRVTRRRPCPICGKPDWCLLSGDGQAAICARIQSERRCGNAGWLHRHGQRMAVPERRQKHMAEKFRGDLQAHLRQERMAELSADLRVPLSALFALGAGWNTHYRAWGFPMRDDRGHLIGIRLRRKDGRKFSVPGSRNGLFIPRPLSDQGSMLCVCEGPTDCAALYSLGLDVVGRPSNTGGDEYLTALIRQWMPRVLVIFVDRDRRATHAERLTRDAAVQLSASCRCDTRIIRTPAKDARAWITMDCATAEDVAGAIANAESV